MAKNDLVEALRRQTEDIANQLQERFDVLDQDLDDYAEQVKGLRVAVKNKDEYIAELSAEVDTLLKLVEDLREPDPTPPGDELSEYLKATFKFSKFEQSKIGSPVFNVRIKIPKDTKSISYGWITEGRGTVKHNDGHEYPQPSTLTDTQDFTLEITNPVWNSKVRLLARVTSNAGQVRTITSDLVTLRQISEPIIVTPDQPNPNDFSVRVTGLEGLAKISGAKGQSVYVDAGNRELGASNIFFRAFEGCRIVFAPETHIRNAKIKDGEAVRIWFDKNVDTSFEGLIAHNMPHDAFTFRDNADCEFHKFESYFSYLSGFRLIGGNVRNLFADIVGSDARQSYGNGDSDADGFSASYNTDIDNVIDRFLFEFNADDGGDGWLSLNTLFKNGRSLNNGKDRFGNRLGNGNGFKLGGKGQDGTASCENCEASYNLANGFDTNTGTGIHFVKNCRGEGNGGQTFVIYNNGSII